jgi:hypothetical protein
MNDQGSVSSQRARKLSELDVQIEAAERRLDEARDVHRQMWELNRPLKGIELRIKEIAKELGDLLAARLALKDEMEADPDGTKV